MKSLFLLISASALLCSCAKEQVDSTAEETTGFQTNNHAATSRDNNPGSTDAVLALEQFGLLGMENGTFTVNSGTTVSANLGYSTGVTSGTNQKVSSFTGEAYVDSRVSSFVYAAATFQPSKGMSTNDPATDNLLGMANMAASAVSTQYASLSPSVTLGNLTTSRNINASGANTVVAVTSVDYNSAILTLTGRPGLDDGFIINVSGDFNFSQSEVRLVNVRPERVIFNFPNASNILVNKAASIFNGTILAPGGSVIYHNPASFNGAIIAKNIAVHSSFNLAQRPFDYMSGPQAGN